MKTLIIAEKPSVAADLAKALKSELGTFSKKGKSRDSSYFDNDQAAITSAVGHLVELKMPQGPNGKGLPWKFDVLPVIPEQFELQPIERSAARFNHIRKLVKSKDVTLIVNACDAGREGELIFQYIMDLCKVDKPVQRLWMQSMTTGGIREAWKNLRDGQSMSALSDAARCRSEADWVIGLNGTRALTCFRSRHGGFNITPVGRVQTPTLAILAKREREILAFVSDAYSEVHAEFTQTGSYSGVWFDPDWRKDSDKPLQRAERIWDPEQAERIRARCDGKDGIVTEEKKPRKQIAPQLYDLTTLQRESPFTAKQTLSIAQALYAKHKMVTYPRTSSRYLPEDYVPTVIETTQKLAKSELEVSKWAKDSLTNDRIQLQKRVFDNAKIDDHFAIIPTGKVANLRDGEQKLYDMIVKRFIAVFFPHAEFEMTERITTIDHGTELDKFRSKGKVLVKPGYLAVYGREVGTAEKGELTPVISGEAVQVASIEVQAKETKPPARYTEATLLSAMEGAGKLVEDQELREAMAERGLGTPATRAATIEGLLGQKYLARDGRDLNVTGRGLHLMDLLEEMKVDALCSPALTGDWEAQLSQMKRGQLDRADFMEGIGTYTRELVDKVKGHYTERLNAVFDDLDCVCPNCGAKALQQTDATYQCREEECTFKISKWVAGRELLPIEAKELFESKILPERSGFMSRFNKPFDAALELVQPLGKKGQPLKWRLNFVFNQDDAFNPEDLTEDLLVQRLTLNTGADASLYATEKVYFVPELKTKDKPDGFELRKTILQRELEPNDVIKLLTEGKTGLIERFISNRTKRPFKAYLTLDFESGKIGFEFQPRPTKK